MLRAVALAFFLAVTPAAAARPFLSIHRARHAIQQPGMTVTHCHHVSRVGVKCVATYEGQWEVEPGSGWRAEEHITAYLCGGRIYQLLGSDDPMACRAIRASR